MDVAASFQAWSEDNGETWSRLQSTALAPSTAPAQIRTRISSAISRNGGSVWKFFQNVESMHEETHVEPGPIRPVRTAEYHLNPDYPCLNESENIFCLSGFTDAGRIHWFL